MPLTPPPFAAKNGRNHLVHYLAERGLVSYESIVDGDVMVAPSSARHSNFAIIRRSAPAYFVKQIRADQPIAAETLAREAALYRLAAADAKLEPLRTLMPRFHAYDPLRHVLVIELLDNAASVAAYHRSRGAFPPELADAIGRALARYHDNTRAELLPQAALTSFPRTIPWALSFHAHMPYFQNVSAANRQLFELLNRHPQFAAALERARRGYRFDALIHGDMKFDNCMFDPAAAVPLRIIDWEMADIGDADWDAGAIFHSYLGWWASTVPIGSDGAPQPALASAPLHRMQPAMNAFWRAYAAEARIEPQDAQARLERTVAYAGARLLQTVYESLAGTDVFHAPAVLQTQMSLNILSDPPRAAVELLGIVHA